MPKFLMCLIPFLLTTNALAFDGPSQQQLTKWLKQFPKADTNGDGKLTAQEANAFRQKLQKSTAKRRPGIQTTFKVDPGWKQDRFPDSAVCYRTPAEIKEIFSLTPWGKVNAVTSYPRPSDGALRIVGTGHSFMAPGFTTLPAIARAGGFNQPPLVTHTGGGMTGSARYKWEQENGIFQFNGKPTPKLLASVSNAEWDAMMWGPYYQDRPEYYSCWMDFCLKYNPEMKFYLADAWPQLGQLKQVPKLESDLTVEVFRRLGKERNVASAELLKSLNGSDAQRVFTMPTCDAMVLAAESYLRGELPGVEGLHRAIGGKERSLWSDQLGHLGPGFGDLEGYVFYATLYGRSPELIEGDVNVRKREAFPGRELDREFRRIAWQAVVNHPLSGVTDKNENGLNDSTE